MTTSTTIDPDWFRQVLGRYPTGVAVVTSTGPDGEPLAMVVGTFTSVSLNPPLVGFLPAVTSTTWPRIRESGRFCVNILSASQVEVCRLVAGKPRDLFERLAWRQSARGCPLLTGAIAWVDCDIHSTTEVGDHWFVAGRVIELDVAARTLPLLFFQGGYGPPWLNDE